MEIIHYLRHYKIENIFVDYFEHTKQGVVKYVLKVDGKTIYEGYEQLCEDEILVMAGSML